eukprot:7062838-Pyramimonas_sp.AAC.1
MSLEVLRETVMKRDRPVPIEAHPGPDQQWSDFVHRAGDQVVEIPREVRGAFLEFHWPLHSQGLSEAYQRWSTAAEMLFCSRSLSTWPAPGGRR